MPTVEWVSPTRHTLRANGKATTRRKGIGGIVPKHLQRHQDVVVPRTRQNDPASQPYRPNATSGLEPHRIRIRTYHPIHPLRENQSTILTTHVQQHSFGPIDVYPTLHITSHRPVHTAHPRRSLAHQPTQGRRRDAPCARSRAGTTVGSSTLPIVIPFEPSTQPCGTHRKTNRALDGT